MKTKELTLSDKLIFLANASAYSPLLDKPKVKQIILHGAIFSVTTVCLAAGILFTPALLVGAVCFGATHLLLAIDDYQKIKNIIKKCGGSTVSYKDYKKMKKSGELKFLAKEYSATIREIIDRQILGDVYDKYEIYTSKKESLDAEVASVFGLAKYQKSVRQMELDQQSEDEVAKVFGSPSQSYQTVNDFFEIKSKKEEIIAKGIPETVTLFDPIPQIKNNDKEMER